MFSNFLKKDEPVKIKFLFDQERAAMKYIKIWRRLYAGTSIEPEADSIQFMAHFMVDKNDQYLPEDKAIALMDELSPSQFAEESKKFMDGVSEHIVKKASGSNSSSSQPEAGLTGTLPNSSQS